MIKLIKRSYLVSLLIAISLPLRLYGLSWGFPYFFHPDENNISTAVLSLSKSFGNPHFFAYGALPMYLTFLSVFLLNKGIINFGLVILTTRFLSAILSIILIPSIFYIGKNTFNKNVGLIAAVLTTFSVGFIQFGHFGTFELWSTFFMLWLFYFSIKLYKNLSLKNLLTTAILSGILVSIKISNIEILVLPIFIILHRNLIVNQQFKKLISLLSIYLLITFLVFVITNPYSLLDLSSFINGIHYESSVALGTTKVFYTQSFLRTTPIIFQLFNVYPFLINPFTEVVFLFGFIYIFTQKRKIEMLILSSFFLILFLPQATLFVKWTRYMVPTLPFIYLTIGNFVSSIKNNLIRKILIITLVTSSIVFSFSYFYTVFLHNDSRLGAANWLANNFPKNKKILTESYDLGIIPFNSLSENILIFDFYSPDSLSLEDTLKNSLNKNDLIILPSQRVAYSRILNPKDFPKGNLFYRSLLENKTDFKEVFETPCDIFCKIAYLDNPILNLEQTTSVFDRPIVTIFKK